MGSWVLKDEEEFERWRVCMLELGGVDWKGSKSFKAEQVI